MKPSIISWNYPKLVRNRDNGKVYVMTNVDYDKDNHIASCMVQEIKADTPIIYNTLSEFDKHWDWFRPSKGETLIKTSRKVSDES